jgi:cell division protein FtsW
MKEKKKKTNIKPFDFILCITVFLLLALGIVMVLSASAPSSLSTYNNSYHYVVRQAGFALAGIVLMFIISRIDYRIYKKFYKVAYWVSIIAIALVVVPGVGVKINGARRWINLGFGQFQPSEIAKIGLIIFYAAYLSDNKNKLNSFWDGFVKPFIYLIPPIAILFFIQDHLSASLIIIAIISIMMIMAGSKLKYFLTAGVTVGGAGIVGMLALAKLTGQGKFRLARLTTFLDPWSDAKGDGWQVIQGLYAIGSGGLFGVGLGQSKQKYLYIPEPHNDFIFAVLAEELGFVGCVFVIALFAIFIWRGILTALRVKDSFGSLLAVGITSLIGLQAIMNIAVVTSSMPVTGISLPFFSYGGTSLLILLCSVGILLNISRSGAKV